MSVAGNLLRKDLYKIVNLFKKDVVVIPTNGFLTDNIIDQVKKIDTSGCELTINFSLDGMKDTHNKIRKMRKVGTRYGTLTKK